MARAGDRIAHPLWGRGRVRAVLDGGQAYLVSFDAKPALPRRVFASQLEPRARRALPVIAFRAPPPDLRQALEALRLGVVPTAGLDSLTVAREVEIDAIRALLRDARGLLMLSGSYGTGKTHLIEVAESLALRANCLVARASFDPVEVPPSHPLRLYRALARGLRYPDSSRQGLQPLLEALADRPTHQRSDGPMAHRYLTPAAWAQSSGDEALAADMVAYVQAQLPQAHKALLSQMRRQGWRGYKLLALPDYRSFGQIMAYLLGGIAVWAREAGYRGLVVLADEAEYLERLRKVAREWATNVLRYLASASLDPQDLAFDPSKTYRGGQPVHRALPERFRPDQPLAVICAFTPHPGISEVLGGIVADEGRLLQLQPIPLAELSQLADRILVLCRQAYPQLQPPGAHRRVIKACLARAFRRGDIQTTRQAARLAVEFWDLYRVSAERALGAVME